MSNLSKDDIGKIAVAIFLLLTAVGVGYNSCLGPGSVHKYLGKWNSQLVFNSLGGYKENHVWTIAKWTPPPNKWPKKAYKLKTGQTAHLVKPIMFYTTLNRSRSYGGIYRVDGRHAIIGWFKWLQKDAILGIKLEGGKLKLGHRKDGDTKMKWPPDYWQSLTRVNSQ